MNFVKTLASCLLFTIVTLPALFGQNAPPPSPAAWSYTCGDGVEVDLIGKGIRFQGASAFLAIPNPGEVQQITVETVCKYACPTEISFVTSKDTVKAQGIQMNIPGSTWPQQARVYRATLSAGNGVDSVFLQGANSYYFLSLVGYVFRNSGMSPKASVATFIEGTFWHVTKSYVLHIPKGQGLRDVDVRIPVGDLNNDPRVGIFSASMSSGSDTVAFSTFDPALGPSLRIVTMKIKNVQANDTVLTVTINSPSGSKNGDSFLVGGAISVEASCDNRPPVAINDFADTYLDLPVTGNVLANDFDPDGDPLTVNLSPVVAPTHGTLALNADGTYVFTPAPGFKGTDSFQYEVCDNRSPALCDTAEVFLEVLERTLGNDPPIANIDVVTTLQDQAVNGNVLVNDFDPDQGILTVNTTPIAGPTNGTLSLNADGTFSYTPNAGFVGDDTFTYEVCDDGSPALCDQAQVFVRVISGTGGNNPPFAADDAFAGLEDQTISGDVSVNDGDPDGDALAYNPSPIEGPFHGSLTLQPDGSFSYEPDSAYFGPDYFVYEVCDNQSPALCARAAARILVLPENSAPRAQDDINVAFSGFAISGNVLANDTDPDGDDLTASTSPVSGPAHGTLQLNGDGSYSYTPDANYVGKDTFRYEVCDAGIPGPLCDTAQVVVTVRKLVGGNKAPFANDDKIQTQTNSPIRGNALANDGDPDGDQLTAGVNPVSGPTNGTVSISPQGVFSYVPAPGFEGEDSFTYEVCDDGTPSLCDTARVTIFVKGNTNGGDNDPPFADDDLVITQAGKAVSGDVSTNDRDPNGDNLIYEQTPVQAPANGTLTLNADGTFSYQPNAGFFGQDYFVYEVCDDGTPSLCVQASAYILVVPENNPPIVLDDINNTLLGVSVDGNVLTNDYDPDGDNLSANPVPVSGPTNGTLVLNNDGTYTYTPDRGFTGTDTFTYEACDDGIPGPLCATATVTIKVFLVTPGNDKPVANNDILFTKPGKSVSGNVILNDFDPDDDPLTVKTTPVSGPSNGSLVQLPNGSFIYFPNPSFEGTDEFVYEVCDNGNPALCDQAKVTIVVQGDNDPDNDPPFAGDDAFFTPKNDPLGGSVANNDSDPNGDWLRFNLTPIEGPFHGTVILQVDGSFAYTPDSGYVGPDRFVYEVCDTVVPPLCARATVYITVTDENSAPIANPDINLTAMGIPASGNVLTNDIEPDGDDLIVSTTPVSGPTNGTLVLNADGTYTYTPNAGFSGEDRFLYEVCDNGIPGPLCDTAWVSIEVRINTSDNDPPYAVDDFYTTFINLPVSGNVLNNDGDPDGNLISINTTPVVNASNGLVIFLTNGSFIYIPNGGFEGEDSFSYQVCDSGNPSLCDTARVEIRVTPNPGPGNDPPFAGDDAVVIQKGQVASGNVLLNDNDPNGDLLTVNATPVEAPANGVLNLQANGGFSYQPNTGFVGTDRFVYEVCDNGTPSLCARATVYILVMPDPLRCIDLNLAVFLEGPFDPSTSSMQTRLNDLGFLPGENPQVGLFPIPTPAGQPYNIAPWNYSGTEGDLIGDMTGGTPYASTVVDWVLVSIREGGNLPEDEIWKQAALLHKDGTVEFVGSCFETNSNGPFWLLIEHRNHMGVMTAQAVAVTTSTSGSPELVQDFRNKESFRTLFTVGQKKLILGSNVYGMYGSDVDKTGFNNFEINGNDNAIWLIQNGRSEQYSLGDFNLDLEVNGNDNSIWLNNNGQASGVPK